MYVFYSSDRDVQHNISYSVISNCREGAIKYASAGEVNAIMTIERNQFTNNCEKLYGNFTTCKSALWLDVQNTQSLFFRVSTLASRGSMFLNRILFYHAVFNISEQFSSAEPGRTFYSSRFQRLGDFLEGMDP